MNFNRIKYESNSISLIFLLFFIELHILLNKYYSKLSVISTNRIQINFLVIDPMSSDLFIIQKFLLIELHILLHLMFIARFLWLRLCSYICVCKIKGKLPCSTRDFIESSMNFTLTTIIWFFLFSS